jgi:2-keto-4-pentenoate hydratase/2-oxohepta-3-ene-1,7-dioic acid hydratase in catechol pathway
MSRSILLLTGLLLTFFLFSGAQAQRAATPFKLGNFENGNNQFVGVVLNDSTVIDLGTANTQLPRQGRQVDSPTDMKDLISRYDTELRARIIDIINRVNNIRGNNRPDYVHNVSDLKILPPVMYPRTMMNTALNYTEHALEMENVRDDGVDGSAEPGIASRGTSRPGGIWEPAGNDRRWNPYMFLKSPSAIIAHGEAIQAPAKRPEIDWECELGVVIGQEAKNVSLSSAADYIFGYTLEMDVSDREGRGDSRYGSDWLIGKSQDTFAPMGPFITPREFISDPENMDITFILNGDVMQESNTNLMIHNVFEQVVYASNILTLVPGDVIATGTPSGVGSARTPPIFLKPGDSTSCTYEGVGTLENTVIRAR